jgi:hypothetical protein
MVAAGSRSPIDAAPYTVRLARPQELQLALRVIVGAYRSDPTWRSLPAAVGRRVTNRVRTSPGYGVAAYVVAEIEAE